MGREKNPGQAGGRRTSFEVVHKSAIPSLAGPGQRRLRILSVSQDPSLLKTREILFSRAGFQVSSFLSPALAVKACKKRAFDLVIIGHSIPLAERKKMVKEVRAVCTAPILSLLRPHEPQLIEADYFFDPSAPAAQLLETVMDILGLEKLSN